MSTFYYTARDSMSGREFTKVIVADNKQTAIAELLKRDLLVIEIEESKAAEAAAKATGTISASELSLFTRQLATMIDSGLSLIVSLQGLSEQTNNKYLKKVIEGITSKIESGSTFSEALQSYRKHFTKLYMAMVEAGEKSGNLANILARLANYLESAERLRKKVKSATTYPVIVISIALIITTFLLVQVVPQFEKIFAGFGADLPAPTQILLDVSGFLKSNIFGLFFLLIGLIAGFKLAIKTPTGRALWDAARLKIPIFGPLMHKVSLSRFNRTTSTLVKSGVPLIEVLEIVSRTVGNVKMESAILRTAEKVRIGESLSSSLAKNSIFPTMTLQMVTAGEQTGKIDEMMERVANVLDDEVETTLSGLSSLIEPMLIVFLGVTIGGIVLAMFLPIFKMTEIVNQ